MKILAIGDFHSVVPKKLKEFIKSNSIDLILCTGDIGSTDRIEWKYWKNLRAGEKLEDIIGRKRLKKLFRKQSVKSGKVFQLMDRLGVPIVLVYGNGDMTKEYFKRYNIKFKGIESLASESKNIKLIRCGRCRFRDMLILCHSGYRGYTAKKGDLNGKFPTRAKKRNLKWKKDMKRLSKYAKGDFIFLTHDVPLGKLDKINNKNSPINGEHIGDEFYLEFDKKYKPLMHICGHMHENQGTARIGKTVVVNAGFGNMGEAALIDTSKKYNVKFLKI
jgi:Icc-related predicted phosphoesterase